MSRVWTLKGVALASAAAVALGGGVARAADGGVTLNELVVTANKREEKLKDVAMAVAAVPGQTLERLEANSFEDYAKLVPGLSLSAAKPGQTVLTLRGLSSLSAGSTVGVYVDDTPYGSSSGLSNGQFYTVDLNTYDLQRVEVLKGPQGTLYGASTLGGLIKFVTNRPDPKRFEGSVFAATEDTRDSWGWSAKGMINLPLGDKAAIRIVGVRLEDPGYIDNPARHEDNINGSRQTGLRIGLLVQPTAGLTLRLTATGQDSNFDNPGGIDVKTDSIGRPLLPLQPLTGDLQLSQNAPEISRSRYRVYNGSADWDLGWAQLTNVLSYGSLRQLQHVDDTVLGTVVAADGARQHKFTEELRLASRPGQRLDWIAGAYYTRETSRLTSDYSGLYAAAGLDLTGSGVRVAATYREAAVFGTLTYHFTPDLDLAVGARYAHNRQNTDQTGSGIYAAPATSGRSSEDVVLYSVAPRWRVNPDTLVYARLASGYRPGGPNVLPFKTTAAPSSFKADKVVSGEAGLRSELFDKRLSLDLSVFDTRWSDIQLIGIAVIDGVTTGVTQNGGSATSRGFEGAAVLTPTAGLTLALNGAYTDAKLTRDTTELVGGLKGDPLPYVPKWSGALDVNYEHPLSGDLSVFVGGAWAYVGARSTGISPRGAQFEQVRLDSYDTLDLRAGVQRGGWVLELFGRNLGDSRGVSALGTNESGAAAVLPGWGAQTEVVVRPRTVGVSLSGRF